MTGRTQNHNCYLEVSIHPRAHHSLHTHTHATCEIHDSSQDPMRPAEGRPQIPNTRDQPAKGNMPIFTTVNRRHSPNGDRFGGGEEEEGEEGEERQKPGPLAVEDTEDTLPIY